MISKSRFRPLVRGQIYLLEASDLAREPWSQRAADDLLGLYQELYSSLESWPQEENADPVIGARAAQEVQWHRADLLLDALQELIARAVPGDLAQQTASSRRILEYSASLKKKLQTLLSARPVGEGLTAAAIERQSRVRGRVVAPNDALERRFLQNAREMRQALPAKKTKTSPERATDDNTDDDAPDDPAAEPADPNL